PDWKGQPVSTETQPLIQADWENAKTRPDVVTKDYSVHCSGIIAAPPPGHYEFTLEVADSFPYSPSESFRFTLDGKVLGEGNIRTGHDMSVMGSFKAAPGASPTAPPVETFAKNPKIEVDFSDTKPHQIEVDYSPSADQAGGGVTLKWVAPAQAQLDEAVARAKEASVVVAFVGL